MNRRRIPLQDLARQHEVIGDELLEVVTKVAETQDFVLGDAVADFEESAARYIGVRHAIGVASGTDALYLSLRLLELDNDAEVVTSPFSFFATAGAIENAGGRIVFADIDPETFNLDPDAVERVLGPRTRGVLAAHLFGQMSDVVGLGRVTAERELCLIEDAAQSIGARVRVGGVEEDGDEWIAAGACGSLGCFSFYPTKNLGAWGDAGLIATDEDEFASRLRRLRQHGRDRIPDACHHREVGINSRLDSLQAAILNVKLTYLSRWTAARRAHAAWYDERLCRLDPVTVPPVAPDRFHVYNQYTIRAERRDELRAFLAEEGIATGVYYPLALHLQPCFAHLGYREGDFPEAERASREVLSLPVFPELTAAEREQIVAAVERFYAG